MQSVLRTQPEILLFFIINTEVGGDLDVGLNVVELVVAVEVLYIFGF